MTAERRLRELLAHAWEHSPFYREIYTREGIGEQDLPHIALEHLPVVSKSDLMVRFDEAVTDSRLRRADLEAWVRRDTDPLNLYLDEYIIIHSSAGSPIYSWVPYTRDAWRRMTATAAPLLLPPAHGIERPLRTAFFMHQTGHFAGATNVSLASRAAHEVLRVSIFDPVEEIRARLNAFQPERLQSYPSALSWLAEWTLQGRLHIAPRSVLVSGERLTPAMRAQVKRAWNAEIHDLYACAESLYMAAQRPGRSEYQVFTDLNLLEVVDSARRMVPPGTRGRVLLTSLLHATLPLIRFDLCDHAVLGEAGIGAQTLLAVDGKVPDSLPVRLVDGRAAALEVYELAQLELPGVEKLQFVHHSPAEVEILYQSPDDLDAALEAAFRRLLAQKSATIETVRVRRVERILNDLTTYKLRSVIAPGEPMITPSSLAEADHRVAMPAPAPPVEAAAAVAGDLPASIWPLFSQQAVRHPGHPAAIDGDRRLAYGELDQLAAKVAGELQRRDFDARRPVAVLSGHAPDLLPLILGVLRAGGWYVPLDAGLPAGRLQSILADALPQFLLTGAAERAVAATLAAGRCAVLCVDEMSAAPPPAPAAVAPTAPACLLYTSGSTGTPKGVVLSHATVVERAARYVADYRIRREDRLSLLQSFAVSAGIREIWGALLGGATLVFHDVRARGVEELAHCLNHTGVTMFYAVPTVFRRFLETLTDEVFGSVRVVRLGGEPLRESDVSGFRQHFPRGCILANGYAASETDTICQAFMDHDTRIVAGRIPAGIPAPRVDVTVCDDQGNPADGALGEIRVAGTMLASGYWDARSARVRPFALPFATGDLGYRLADGRVFLAGRRDLVVKVHGYRVHLDEIERAARRVPHVVDATAVVQSGPHDGPAIVVYYEADGEAVVPDTAALRRAVAAIAPWPVQPGAYVRLPALPRLAGGDVDRGSLAARPAIVPRPVTAEPVYASVLEARLARAWRDVLHVPAPAPEADFFDAGGDSISVFRVLDRIRSEFGVDLTVAQFFAHPALAELARAIERLQSGPVADGNS